MLSFPLAAPAHFVYSLTFTTSTLARRLQRHQRFQDEVSISFLDSILGDCIDVRSSARACTPPPQRPPSSLLVPSTPGPGCKRPATERSLIPPSPGPNAQVPTPLANVPVPILQAVPKTKEKQLAGDAAVVEPPPKKRQAVSRTARNDQYEATLNQSFRFLDLPAGESLLPTYYEQTLTRQMQKFAT